MTSTIDNPKGSASPSGFGTSEAAFHSPAHKGIETAKTGAETTKRVAEAAHAAVDRAAAGAGRAEEKIRRTAGEAEEILYETVDAARQTREEVVRRTSGFVHDHPVASVGIAFIAGSLFAALLRR